MNAAWTLRRTMLAERPATDAEFDQIADLIRRRLTRAVGLCRRAGDPRALVTALGRLGHLEHDADHRDDAVGRHADAYRSTGRLAEAETCYNEALALYAAEDEPPALDYANALRPLALLKEMQGRTDEARNLWRRARALYARIPIPAGKAECDEHLTRLG